MKQVFITGQSGERAFEIRESPDPLAAANELRIRVKASGVNFADILAAKGLYPDAPRPPCVVGYEVSGIVDAAGSPELGPWVGREVFALTRFGGYADTIVVPLSGVFEKPKALTHSQCVAIPVNYLTAWQLIVVMGALARTDRILIHNAGGGVGLAAIDVARHVGATIFGTASPGKHVFLKERGVHQAIDYVGADWSEAVMYLTDGRGVELILDPLGGAHWKKSYKALRHTGRLGMFGVSTVVDSRLPGPLRMLGVGINLPWFNPVPLMNQNRAVFGVNMGHLWHEPDKIRLWMNELLKGVDDGWVRPHVDREFPLGEVAAAHAHILARRNTGKVVLVA